VKNILDNGKDNLINETKSHFLTQYGSLKGSYQFITPCSLILLGDHTHYNDGILISVALNKYAIVIIKKRHDDIINLFDATVNKKISFSVSQLNEQDEFVFRHHLCLLKILNEIKPLEFGFDSVIATEIPECLGLGSLASVEVGFAFAVKKIFNFHSEDKELLAVVKKCELQSIGKISNIAHHYSARFENDNSLFNIDLRNLEYKKIHLKNNNFNIVVLDSQEKIPFVSDLCNERVEECEIGVKGLRLYIWGIKNLRDIEQDFLFKHFHMLPRRIFNRVLYNVKERSRVEKALDYIKKNSVEEFGKCINDSHWSLSSEYEISSPKIDFIVEKSSKITGVIASKMISCSPWRSSFHIVKEESTNNFIKQIKKLFKEEYQSELVPHIFKISNGLKESLIKESEPLNTK
jgi:galactokinase